MTDETSTLPEALLIKALFSVKSLFVIVLAAPAIEFCFWFNAVCVAVLIGLFASLVLSTLPNPTAVLSNVCHVLSPLQYCAVVPAVMAGSASVIPYPAKVLGVFVVVLNACVWSHLDTVVADPVTPNLTEIVLPENTNPSPAVTVACFPFNCV